MKIFYGGFVLFALLIATVKSTDFKRCSEGVIPTRLEVYGCPKTPCNFYRGKWVRAQADFVMPRATDILIPKVTAKKTVFFVPISKDIPMTQTNACNFLHRGKCPLKKGDAVTYDFAVFIQPNEIRTAADVEVSLHNRSGDTLACISIPVTIL